MSDETIGLIVQGRDFRRPIEATQGDTLLAALKRAGVPMLSVCGGRAACGSCKIGVAPAWSDHLPPPGKAERRLLAHLADYRDGERLACQLILSAMMEGLEIRVAA